LALVEKELQQARKDNQTLAQYINARRKNKEVWRKEEVRKKADEKTRRKMMVMTLRSDEGQSFKDVRT
jgi:hypothetical protein